MTSYPFKDKRVVCCILGLSACRAVNTLHLGYKTTSQLVMYKVKAAVCSEICAKHITQCEHYVGFLDVKPGGT
jgi:hypothetical protein